ncbi:MAG: RHS repeat-associated core domain-containing protein [Bacteroidota bacterium]
MFKNSVISSEISSLTDCVVSYRYGFNGKEKEGEISEGDLDFGAKIYDSKIARWLSVDSKASKFPFESPYVYVSNSPTICIDPDGDEKIVVSGGKIYIKVIKMQISLSKQLRLN